MKGDQIGTLTAHPSLQELSLSNWTWFKSGNRRLVLRVMARTGRELAIVHGPQLAAQGLLGDGDPELLPDPGDEVDQAPAHHAVNRRDRARIDPGHQGGAMRIGEFR